MGSRDQQGLQSNTGPSSWPQPSGPKGRSRNESCRRKPGEWGQEGPHKPVTALRQEPQCLAATLLFLSWPTCSGAFGGGSLGIRNEKSHKRLPLPPPPAGTLCGCWKETWKRRTLSMRSSHCTMLSRRAQKRESSSSGSPPGWKYLHGETVAFAAAGEVPPGRPPNPLVSRPKPQGSAVDGAGSTDGFRSHSASTGLGQRTKTATSRAKKPASSFSPHGLSRITQQHAQRKDELFVTAPGEPEALTP